MSEQYSSQLLRGSVFIANVANPAAGADWADATPNNMYTEIQSIHFQLVTSAAVVTRNVIFLIADAGGNQIYRVNAPQTITAGQTRRYIVSANHAPNTILYPTAIQIPIPPGLILGHGFFYGTNCDGPLDAADQLSDIRACVLRCAFH